MKKVVLMLITVFAFAITSQAQTKNKDLAVGIHLGDKEYGGDYGSEVFKFEGVHLAGGISLTKYLSPSWDGLAYVSYGMIDNGDSAYTFQTKILDVNAAFKYKFNNGYIFKEDAMVAPFLFVGIGDSYNVGTHLANGNNFRFNFPIGGGFDININEKMAVTFMSVYNQFLSDDIDGWEKAEDRVTNDCFVFNSIGLKFLFPSKDTDGDGITDEADNCPAIAGSVATQGCPEIKAADKEIMSLAMRGLLFETGSAKMLAESYSVLDNVYSVLSSNEIYKLSIEGHTDNTGSDEINTKLSGERAQAARDYLINKGISSTRVVATGYGSAKPVVTNDTPEGRKQNRRVEFKLMF